MKNYIKFWQSDTKSTNKIIQSENKWENILKYLNEQQIGKKCFPKENELSRTITLSLIYIFIIIIQREEIMNTPNQYFLGAIYFCKVQLLQNDPATYNSPNFAIDHQLIETINAQNIRINQLLQQRNELYKGLFERLESSESNFCTNDNESSNKQQNGKSQFYNPQKLSFGSHILGNRVSQSQMLKAVRKPTKIIKCLKKVDFMVETNSSSQQAPQNTQKRHKRRQNQSKNMVKNFAKSIFSYIRKNSKRKQKVLESLGIAQLEFTKVFEKYSGHIHSITQLRSLWSAEGNPFHKAFRMLSSQYLRKHCLGKTFNSRVQNHPVHLKYRKRLLDILENPTEFTALKTN